tara:strand:+ start:3179 stop:3814 length:636 start_codon:yes stop_codon:yes gene_type:complete
MAGKIKEATTTEIMSPAAMMIEPSDIEIPRINVVQKTSEIDAPFGSIVLDKQFVIAEPEKAVAAIPVSVLKGWREDIPYDDDEVPRIANSQEERDEIAKSSDYPMLEFADITLAIAKPEDTAVEAAFPFPIGNEFFALGRINVAKDAYRQTFKRLATFTLFNPETPAFTRFWDFTSALISRGKYSWYAPSLTFTDKETSEAVQKFANNFSS